MVSAGTRDGGLEEDKKLEAWIRIASKSVASIQGLDSVCNWDSSGRRAEAREAGIGLDAR
jgi:hypothetical protein